MAVTKSATFLFRTANDFALTFITLSIILHLSAMYRQSIQDTSEIFTKTMMGLDGSDCFYLDTQLCVKMCMHLSMCRDVSGLW